MKFLLLSILASGMDTQAFTAVVHKLDTSSTALHYGIDRRSAISTSFGISALVAHALPAVAGTTPPTPQELERIREGYKDIQYLLNMLAVCPPSTADGEHGGSEPNSSDR